MIGAKKRMCLGCTHVPTWETESATFPHKRVRFFFFFFGKLKKKVLQFVLAHIEFEMSLKPLSENVKLVANSMKYMFECCVLRYG